MPNLMRARRTQFVAVLIGGLCLSLPGLARAGSWWRQAWPRRVEVTLVRPGRTPAGTGAEPFMPKLSGLPGEDVAAVSFRTAGQVRPDGRDAHVVTTRGQEVPCRVLMSGPGNLCRVAFALRPDVPKYYVYFGNPAAPAAPGLDIRRGVLEELWPYPGGPAQNLEQARRTLTRAQASALLGCDFREQIFFGYNPFGPQGSIAGLYTAFFVAPTEGQYDFALSSQNASFLLVDDQLLVQNGGWHGPYFRIRVQGRTLLKGGLHKLTFLHISPWGDPIAVLMWRPPGGKWALMPPKAFTPVYRARAGVIEDRGQSVNVDFAVVESGETFLENRYLQRRVFEGVLAGRGDHGITWRWDFGDGQSAAGQRVEHVFLSPGVYRVTLRASGYSRPLEITHAVAVDRLWDQQHINRLDRVDDYAKIVAGYDLAKLSSRANMEAVLLFRRARDTTALQRALDAFLKRPAAAPEEIRTVLPIHVEALLSGVQPGGAEGAVAALLHAVEMSRDAGVRAEMLRRAGQVSLDVLDQPENARKFFQRASGEPAGEKAARLAGIGQGDAWRAQGDFAKAMDFYLQAGDELAGRSADLIRGDFSRQAEAYLRSKDYDAAQEALDAWESALPADRLEGYSTLLRVRLENARRNFAGAAREAQRLAGVNPESPYTPELLMQAYQAYTAMRRTDDARKALQRIVKDYRESPLSAKAKKVLGE